MNIIYKLEKQLNYTAETNELYTRRLRKLQIISRRQKDINFSYHKVNIPKVHCHTVSLHGE